MSSVSPATTCVPDIWVCQFCHHRLSRRSYGWIRRHFLKCARLCGYSIVPVFALVASAPVVVASPAAAVVAAEQLSVPVDVAAPTTGSVEVRAISE